MRSSQLVIYCFKQTQIDQEVKINLQQFKYQLLKFVLMAQLTTNLIDS